MVRTLIERQLKLARVIKRLNFIRDDDNEVTDILTTEIHSNAIIATNEKLRKTNSTNEKRSCILGEHITDCNPYRPRWEAFEEMNTQQ